MGVKTRTRGSFKKGKNQPNIMRKGSRIILVFYCKFGGRRQGSGVA